VRGGRIGRTRKQLADFLGRKTRVVGTTIDLQPLIVSFRDEPHEKAGWRYEHGGNDDSSLSE
jgi:hypothetical protein